MKTRKSIAGLADLESQLSQEADLVSCLGLAHTRWATHGGVTTVNAHPHVSQSGDLVGVHNGVIENYLTLKKKLLSLGYKFQSDTDTEVAINFIEWLRVKQKLDLVGAVQMALPEISGACVLVLYSVSEKKLVAVNKGGQLCVGKQNKEYYIASDRVAFAGQVDNFFDIADGQLVVVDEHKDFRLLDLHQDEFKPQLKKLDIDIQELELGDYPNFMLKEIFSQPQVIFDSTAGRLNPATGKICLGGLTDCWPQILKANHLTIIACGTSWHAGLLAKYWLEELAGISVNVEYASEFRAMTIKKGDIVIAISQSGETADTLSALELARSRGAIVIGICNRVGSALARKTDAGIYIRAGVELGVASTKAFVAQSMALLLLTLKLADDRATAPTFLLKEIAGHLEILPRLVEKVLGNNNQIRELAKKFKTTCNFLYLGRHYNFPVALEGALKLKEISYIHAEGMSAGEMKHGPLALVDRKMVTVVCATPGRDYGKIINNISEIKARHGKIIAVVSEGDAEAAKLADRMLVVPLTHEVVSPLLNVIPLQLLAYHLADLRGCNVDRPRNLAKSVTVQ
jgi:glucosamine--fructose-6-phosphate aminotransferase (isomerizing)